VQRNFRTRWLESVLGVALVLLLVVAVCAGAFVGIKWFTSRGTTTPNLADVTNPDDPNGEAVRPDVTTPAPAAVTGYSSPKPQPRPAGLFGSWESRADDGSSSSFVFWPDGRVQIAQAGDPPPPPLESNWYVTSRKDADMALEVGPEFGAIGNTRIFVRLTGPDAFTLNRQVRHGVVTSAVELRYIRVGPAPEALPAAPAKSPGNPPPDKSPSS
jgi:hypothetical protein